MVSMGSSSGSSVNKFSANTKRDKIIITIVVFMAYTLSTVLVNIIIAIVPTVLVIHDDTRNHTANSHFATSTTSEENDPSLQDNETFSLMVNNNDTVMKYTGNVKIGLLFGMRGCVQLIVNPLFGLLIDKTSPVVTLLIGMLLDITSATVYGFAQTYPVFMLARILNAFGCSAAGCGSYAALSEYFSTDEERRRILGVLHVFIFAAVSIAPPYGGAVHQFVGQKWVFIFLYPLWILAAVLTIPLCHGRLRKSRALLKLEEKDVTSQMILSGSRIEIEIKIEQPADKKFRKLKKKRSLDSIAFSESVDGVRRSSKRDMVNSLLSVDDRKPAPFWKLLTDGYVLIGGLGIAINSLGVFCLQPTLSTYMRMKFHAEEYEQGVVWVGGVAFHFCGTLVAGVFCNRWPRRTYLLIMFTITLSGLCIFAITFIDIWFLLFLPLGINFFNIAVGEYGLVPFLSTLVDIRYSSVYGSISSIVMGGISLGSCMGAFLSGPLIDAFGFENFILIISCSMLSYTPLLLITHKYWR